VNILCARVLSCCSSLQFMEKLNGHANANIAKLSSEEGEWGLSLVYICYIMILQAEG
jgi:hypothetical protein